MQSAKFSFMRNLALFPLCNVLVKLIDSKATHITYIFCRAR